MDLAALDRLRAAGRLERSNAEASVERLSMEPAARPSIAAATAAGVLAAARRLALASLSLHAERGPRDSAPHVTPLATAIVLARRSLASPLRDRTAPPGVPGLRDRQLALAAATRGPAADDIDMMVDAINAIATLLAPRATDSARPRRDDVE